MPTRFLHVARHIAAVVVGYVVFAGLSAALFALTRRDPHVVPDRVFLVFSLVFGVLAGIMAGFVAAWVGGRNPLSHARTLALGIAAVAIVSLLARPAGGSPWTELATLALFAPAALVGGWLRAQQRKPRSVS
jgi:hypothetical protein